MTTRGGITIAFVTGREDPRLDWVIEGLAAQADIHDEITLVLIDFYGRSAADLGAELGGNRCPWLVDVIESPPKPTIWQGPHRVTSRDWWAQSNARNTALVLCPTDYIAFLDDRCELGPDWLETVRRGDRERASVLAGAYEKFDAGLAIATDAQRTTADSRKAHAPASGRINCGGSWLFGCTFALPLAWALEVNGFEEGCDGISMEDVIFGSMLANRGRRIDYAPGLFVHQHRARSSDHTFHRADKGKSPDDKSHAMLTRFATRKRTELTADLTAMRERIAERGAPGWPVPVRGYPYRDWYDEQLISEMDPTTMERTSP